MSRYIEKFNKWFRKNSAMIIKLRWIIIAAVVVMNCFAFIGMQKIQMETSFEGWFLEDDPLRIAQDQFKEIFGNNEYVVILVEAENVYTSEILTMMRELGDELERDVPFADKVTSLTHLEFTLGTEDGIKVDELVPEEIPTDSASLKEIRRLAMTKQHLVGRLFSRDGTKAAIFLKLKSYVTDDNTSEADCMYSVGEAVLKITNADKYSDFTLLTAGMPVSEVEEKLWTSAEGGRLISLTLLIMIILLAVFIRSWIGVVAPIITAISAIFWIFGGMGWFGIKAEAFMFVVPVLVLLVVSIGYSIHVMSFFKQRFIATGDRREAIAYSLEHAAWPILFTVLTTMVGFLSFTVVPMTAFRWLGLTSTSLVVAAYPLVILLIPVLLSFGKDRKPNPEYVKKGGGWSELSLVRFGNWVKGHGGVIISIFAVIVLIFGIFLTKVEVNTDMVKMMGLKVPYFARITHVANSIGSLYAYDATFDFGEAGRAKDPEVLMKLDTLSAEINKFRIVKRTSSINDVVKDINQTMHGDDPAYYCIPEDRDMVAQLLLLYEMSGGTEAESWVDYDYSILRLNVELKAYSTREAEEQLDYINKRSSELFPGATFGLTGSVVAFGKAANYIVDGQIKSVFIALIGISIIMMFVFGSVRLGLIGMIPNIAPVVLAVGAMGLLGTPLHFLTMMIAPMIIGIAVDDTIHYISHFKLAFLRTGSYEEANRETFRTVGKAIFMTSLVIVLGFSVFITSDGNAYKHLGLYTGIAVLTALAADYFVTPILIMWTKPFGKEKNTTKGGKT